MNAMALPFRFRIRNSSPVCLRSSRLPLGHGGSPQHGIFTSERGRNILFLFFKLEGQSGVRTRDLRHSKQAALTIAPYRAPANQPRESPENGKMNYQILASRRNTRKSAMHATSQSWRLRTILDLWPTHSLRFLWMGRTCTRSPMAISSYMTGCSGNYHTRALTHIFIKKNYFLNW